MENWTGGKVYYNEIDGPNTELPVDCNNDFLGLAVVDICGKCCFGNTGINCARNTNECTAESGQHCFVGKTCRWDRDCVPDNQELGDCMCAGSEIGAGKTPTRGICTARKRIGGRTQSRPTHRRGRRGSLEYRVKHRFRINKNQKP